MGNPDLASFYPIRRHKSLELQCSQYEPFDWSLFSLTVWSRLADWVEESSRSIRAASGGLHTAEQGVPGPGAEPEAGFSCAGQTCLHLRRYTVSKPPPPPSQTCSSPAATRQKKRRADRCENCCHLLSGGETASDVCLCSRYEATAGEQQSFQQGLEKVTAPDQDLVRDVTCVITSPGGGLDFARPAVPSKRLQPYAKLT